VAFIAIITLASLFGEMGVLIPFAGRFGLGLFDGRIDNFAPANRKPLGLQLLFVPFEELFIQSKPGKQLAITANGGLIGDRIGTG